MSESVCSDTCAHKIVSLKWIVRIVFLIDFTWQKKTYKKKIHLFVYSLIVLSHLNPDSVFYRSSTIIAHIYGSFFTWKKTIYIIFIFFIPQTLWHDRPQIVSIHIGLKKKVNKTKQNNILVTSHSEYTNWSNVFTF